MGLNDSGDTGSYQDRVFSLKSRSGWNNDLGICLGSGGATGISC